MIVHLCLRTSGRKASSWQGGPVPRWAITPGIIIISIIIIIIIIISLDLIALHDFYVGRESRPSDWDRLWM